MQTLAKLLIGAIGLVVAIAVAVLLAVMFLVDPDDYRGVIAGTVERQTGRSLVIEGSLGLRKFPCCAITLGRTEIGNPPGFDAGRFATLEAAELDLRVWPLLTRREVVIGRVLLDGLQADLVRRADGSSNWDFGGAPADALPPPGAEQAASVDLALSSIAGVDIRRARISLADASAGADYLFEDVSLQTGPISAEDPFDLRGTLIFTDRDDGTRAVVDLRARALADLAAATATLNDLRATLDLSGPALPAQRIGLVLSTGMLQLDAGGETTRATLDALTVDLTLEELPDVARGVVASLRAPGLSAEVGAATTVTLPALSGSVEIAGLAPVESLSGRIEGTGITLRLQESSQIGAATLTAALAVSGRQLPGGSADINATLRQLDLSTETMAGSFGNLEATVRGAGLNATLTGAGRFGDSRADASGTLELAPFSPRELLAALGEEVPVTADPEVLKRLSGNARWFQRGAVAGLRDIDLTLDDTRLRGQLEQDGATPPMTRFDLQLDRIDLDRYLAPKPEQPAGRGGSAEPAAPTELPMETIRALRLDGRVRAGELRLSGAQLSGVDATITADGGVLRIDPARATLYGGTYAGKVMIDATGLQARLTLDQQLAGVQAGPLLTDLADSSRLSGLLGATLTGTATGRTDQELLKSLTGNLAFDITDGYIEGMDLWYEITRARSLLRREAPAARAGPKRTPITRLAVSGRMADGVLTSDQVEMQIPAVRLSGSGGLDLISLGLDYSLKARVGGSPKDADGTVLSDLKNVTIPLTIKGSLDDPTVRVDMGGLVGGAAVEALRDRALDLLGGGRRPQPAEQAAPGEPGSDEPAAPAEPTEPAKPRDLLRRSLRDLIDR